MQRVEDVKPARILVVEDDVLIRMTGADMLEDAGFDVIEACSADEAIAILERNPAIHVLFSDVDMPGSMNGLALATLVHERWPDVRLVLTSGHHRFADAELPDDGRFVPKPYDHATVIGTIVDLVSAH